ncbi:MAG: TRAP transporter small permease [Xanthobacteraceae bacterium]|nr:TRAP transporter small permease [Xanthobacteraceae bacterium]PWB63341.1 MAG: C4-dicarboxylate ABC transporter permease [Bradyrhizobiaceae bacterium]
MSPPVPPSAARSRAARLIGRFDRAYMRANAALIVAMMSAMVALVFANVVGRYAFNRSLIWAEELSQYLMVWVTFLGAGLALRYGRHVAMEMLQALLPAALAQALRAGLALVMVGFFLIVAVLGFQLAAFAWPQETPAMNISAGIPYLAVPIGALAFLLHVLLMFGGYVAQRYEVAESLDPGVE